MMRTAFCNRVYKAICEREMVHTAITHDQSTTSTELLEVNSVTSSITSSKPEHHTAPTTLLTTTSTPEEDVSRSTDSSTMSAISTTVALVTSELENDTCRKCCSSQEVNSRELSKTELEDWIATLRFQLAVNKTRLSVQRRKLISVYDSRPGSVAMGGVACTLLVTVIGVIVVPDILALWKFVRNLYSTQQKTLVV
ncbi:cell wall protein IFF11-like [Pecten maximus]|uniref:cell wall protein IFF11-like n=1 Tax=Pecten maximus TaxID=6579 RepID=UPI001458D25D|nr:cell wall protein IFF11-like [Pecten maximus]